MASKAISGAGVSFMRWDDTLGEWVAMSEITGITGPDKSRETIDVTSLDTVSGYREFIGSFRDGGTVQLKMNYTRATYEQMNADFESDPNQHYGIKIPDTENTFIVFAGLVTALALDIQVGDKISADSSIKVSGPPTIDSGMDSL